MTVMLGDVLTLLPTLEDDQYDAIITDPPYSSGGMVRGDRLSPTSSKYQQTGSSPLPDFVGDTRDQRSHGYWCALWLAESWRITRTGGFVMVFTDWRMLATTIDSVQAGGWVYRGIVTWVKTSRRPTANRFANGTEFVVWGTKGQTNDHTPSADSRYPANYWVGSAPRARDHITQKPVGLIAHLMSVLPPGSKVLDPFAGSGTTLRAGRVCGVDVDLIDIDQRWVTSSEHLGAQLALGQDAVEGGAQ